MATRNPARTATELSTPNESMAVSVTPNPTTAISAVANVIKRKK